MQLELPRIADRPDPGVELRGVYVEEWVESLPYADPVATAKTVLEALDRFNRSPVKPAQRFALLELYLPPYELLLDVQEGYHTINTVASVDRHRAQADAARRMALALATGYKIVVAQTLGKRGLFGAARESNGAVQRAVQFLGLALMHCYDEYLPSPPVVWRELSVLLVHALREGLAERQVRGRTSRAELAEGVAATYKRLALTSIVDPYHLPYGDVWRVYDQLRIPAAAARIVGAGEAERAPGCFLIDPDSDRRPSPYGPGASSPERGALVLDARPTLAALDRRLSALRGGEDRLLIDAVFRALGAPARRKAPRGPSEGRVDLVAGLGAIHHVLAAPPGGTGDEAEPGAETDAETGGPRYRPEPWELCDEGPGGIGVLRRLRPTQAVVVGEPVGLRPRGQGARNRWSVGIVRWLRFDDAGECQAGVQIVDASAEPVEMDNPRGNGEDLRALALPAAIDGATVLAPPGTFAAGRVIVLRTERGPVTVRAVTLVEGAATLERFTVNTG